MSSTNRSALTRIQGKTEMTSRSYENILVYMVICFYMHQFLDLHIKEEKYKFKLLLSLKKEINVRMKKDIRNKCPSE